jgi:2-methylcitrate dehydratase PrpD
VTGLAESVAALEFDDLPEAAVTLAAQAVLDTVAVAVAARDEPVVRIVREELAAPGDVRLWGGGSTTPDAAALVNGTAAHALDFDDYAPGSGLHPSAPLVPALLAACALRPVSGRDLITAYVAGYEAQERLGLVLWPSHYARGFHTTGTAGTVGAAAAVARLLGADAATTAHALGIAATDSAGVKAVFGSMGKPYHAGRAAASGLRAARLALRGMTVGGDPLFGRQGLVAAASDATDLTAARTPFGEPWHVLDLVPKLYPACFGTHAAIGGALELRGPSRIRAVELTIPPVLLDVCAIPEPATGLEAKFSLAHTTAAALVHGQVGVATFTDAAVGEPDVVELRDRVRLVVDDSLVKTETGIRIVLDDGHSLETRRDAAGRLWQETPDEVWQRLEAKVAGLVPAAVIDWARRLPDVRDICLDFPRI